jgi:hypothetical protein
VATLTRAEIERRRQEAAHARATGTGSTVRRRCMLDGCPTKGQWVEAPDAAAARREGEEHYRRHHFVVGRKPDPYRS